MRSVYTRILAKLDSSCTKCGWGALYTSSVYYCCPRAAKEFAASVSYFPHFLHLLCIFFSQHLFLSTAYFAPFSFSIFIISCSCRMFFSFAWRCLLLLLLYSKIPFLPIAFSFINVFFARFFFSSVWASFFCCFFFCFSHFHLLCFWLSELPSPHDCKAYFGAETSQRDIEEKRWQTNKTCLFTKKDKNTNE